MTVILISVFCLVLLLFVVYLINKISKLETKILILDCHISELKLDRDLNECKLNAHFFGEYITDKEYNEKYLKKQEAENDNEKQSTAKPEEKQ